MKIITLTKRYRGAILFLLLLTCLDIPFPQLCGDEMKPFGGTEVLQSPVLTISDSTTETLAVQPLPAQHDDSIPVEDDCCCFCCCTHILPAPLFNPAQTDGDLSIPVSAPSNLPLSPPHDLFRPPRLA